MSLSTDGLEQWGRAFRRETLPSARSADFAVAIDAGETGRRAEQRFRRTSFASGLRNRQPRNIPQVLHRHPVVRSRNAA
jgi:hypothetical protein